MAIPEKLEGSWGIGATVPSFLVAFALAGGVAVISRRSAEDAAPA